MFQEAQMSHSAALVTLAAIERERANPEALNDLWMSVGQDRSLTPTERRNALALITAHLDAHVGAAIAASVAAER
jgi:hypothetical protein